MNQMQIALAEAKAYALERPQTTASQLRERFQTLSIWQCRRVMDAARRKIRESGGVVKTEKARNSDPLYQLAKSYGMENPTVTPSHLRSLYAITETQSRFIVRVAREAVRKEKDSLLDEKVKLQLAKRDAARNATKCEVAKRYSREHPKESCESIAKRFGVPATMLRRCRRIDQVATAAAIETKPPKPRRKVNRLHAVMCDGSTIKPTMVKDWKCWVGRFTKVVV